MREEEEEEVEDGGKGKATDLKNHFESEDTILGFFCKQFGMTTTRVLLVAAVIAGRQS